MSAFDYQIEIDWSEVEAFTERLEGFDAAFRAAAAALTRRVVAAIEQGVIVRTPVNTGALRAAWGTNVTLGATIVTGEVFNPLVYAPVMEHGRAPGAMPPVDAIHLWVRRKNIGDGSRSVAYLIARAIGRRGVTGRKMLEKTLNQLEPRIRSWYNELPGDIVRRLL